MFPRVGNKSRFRASLWYPEAARESLVAQQPSNSKWHSLVLEIMIEELQVMNIDEEIRRRNGNDSVSFHSRDKLCHK